MKNPQKHADILTRWAGSVTEALRYLTWNRANTEHNREVIRVLLNTPTAIATKTQWWHMVLHRHGDYLVVFHGRVMFALPFEFVHLQRCILAAIRMGCDVYMSASIGAKLQAIAYEWCELITEQNLLSVQRSQKMRRRAVLHSVWRRGRTHLSASTGLDG